MMRIWIFCLLLGLSGNLCAQVAKDSVTIRGTVTNYDGIPLDSVTVMWQSPSFNSVVQALTDKSGKYEARVPVGKYQSLIAVNFSRYTHFAKPELPKEERCLEFWAWDFIADHDTTLDIRYDRMEVYGMRVFRIPGGMPAYQIYVRPMGLTRFQKWMDEAKDKSLIRGQVLDPKDNQEINVNAEGVLLAPPMDQLQARIWVDGEEVPILMKQEVKEYISKDQWHNAYLFTVNMPQATTDRPYCIFKMELTDLDNGDRGEGLYYLEKENYTQ